MLLCELNLGSDPWSALEDGRVRGTLCWDGGTPLEVSVKIRGAHSRQFPRKSLQVDFTGERLPDGPPDGHTVRRLHANADYIDPTAMRSALSYRLFELMGAPAPLCRHAYLMLSGKRVGIYVMLESVDADFCQRRGWAPGAIFYAVNRHANFALVSGSGRSVKDPVEMGYKSVQNANPRALRQMLTEINLASVKAFPAVVERWIDIDGYLRWLMVAVFVGNRDGFMHNYALYCSPETAQFRIIPWDYDATWGIDIHGRPARLDRVPVTGWNMLSRRLMEQSGYRHRYRQLFLEQLDSTLSPEAIGAMIDTMSLELAPWIDKDPLRTSDKKRIVYGTAVLRQWAENRRALLQRELASL